MRAQALDAWLARSDTRLGERAELRPRQVCFHFIEELVVVPVLREWHAEGIQVTHVDDVVDRGKVDDLVAVSQAPQLVKDAFRRLRAKGHTVRVEATERT